MMPPRTWSGRIAARNGFASSKIGSSGGFGQCEASPSGYHQVMPFCGKMTSVSSPISGRDLRRDRRQRGCLGSDDDDFLRPERARIIGCGELRGHHLAAGLQMKAVFPDGGQMRTARNQRDVVPCPRKLDREMTAAGACAVNAELQLLTLLLFDLGDLRRPLARISDPRRSVGRNHPAPSAPGPCQVRASCRAHRASAAPR